MMANVRSCGAVVLDTKACFWTKKARLGSEHKSMV